MIREQLEVQYTRTQIHIRVWFNEEKKPKKKLSYKIGLNANKICMKNTKFVIVVN